MMSTNQDARAKHPGIIKVIGMGQSLRGDDAAGLEAVRQWLETCQSTHGHPNVQVELAELPGISLLDLLEGSSSAILVDAVHSGTIPGTIHVLTEDQLASFSEGSASAHGWGVAETLSLGRQLTPSSMPENLVLIGIEAGQLALGGALSPEVKSSLPKVTRLIEQFVIHAERMDQFSSGASRISPR
ncbi:MAG TPA: hydrogenase maturation protease [Anaerolineales bacterium]|nr:hydrogenase maturation protease [Anaerolineales bacterium]